MNLYAADISSGDTYPSHQITVQPRGYPPSYENVLNLLGEQMYAAMQRMKPKAILVDAGFETAYSGKNNSARDTWRNLRVMGHVYDPRDSGMKDGQLVRTSIVMLMEIDADNRGRVLTTCGSVYELV